MTIGEAAAASGVSAKMIRYYEAIGLIGRVERNGANYRSYTAADVEALRFLRRARDLGFTVPQMRELLVLRGGACPANADVQRLALEHAALLLQKASEIAAMSQELWDMACSTWGIVPPGGVRPAFPPLPGGMIPGAPGASLAGSEVSEAPR